MIQKDRFIENLKLADTIRIEAKSQVGAVVECGVWRGGMAAGLMRVFGSERTYMLFDSFQGLPQPSSRDGEDARWWLSHPEHSRYFDNCEASLDEVEALLSNGEYRKYNVSIIEGWYADTFPVTSIPPVSFIHIDSDWYDSTKACLERFWPHIMPGGVIVVDDYFDWEGCRRAVHDFLSSVSAREAVERVGKTGGALIHRRGPWHLSESPHLD